MDRTARHFLALERIFDGARPDIVGPRCGYSGPERFLSPSSSEVFGFPVLRRWFSRRGRERALSSSLEQLAEQTAAAYRAALA